MKPMKVNRLQYLPLIANILLVAILASCSSSGKNVASSKIDEIQQRGTLLVGATGDYRPLSYLETDSNKYWGFDVDLAKIIAKNLGVEIQFVPTSWPTLTEDTEKGELFDMAMCGITITDKRKETMLMTQGYLANGKTILCRKEHAKRFVSLEAINQPDVRVMVNPGGLNEKFANENLPDAQIIVHQKNEEIPALVAEGKADIMITEIVEASYYTQTDQRLAAPLIDKPFNHSMMGVLMRKGNDDLLQRVDNIIESTKKDGTLKQLHKKYGFKYNF